LAKQNYGAATGSLHLKADASATEKQLLRQCNSWVEIAGAPSCHANSELLVSLNKDEVQ
jgi:hypothetical protein